MCFARGGRTGTRRIRGVRYGARMLRFAQFPASELKRVYIALHTHLLEHPELMDTDFLTDLQSWLQHVAGQEGVDVSNHAAWDRWLHS